MYKFVFVLRSKTIDKQQTNPRLETDLVRKLGVLLDCRFFLERGLFDVGYFQTRWRGL